MRGGTYVELFAEQKRQASCETRRVTNAEKGQLNAAPFQRAG